MRSATSVTRPNGPLKALSSTNVFCPWISVNASNSVSFARVFKGDMSNCLRYGLKADVLRCDEDSPEAEGAAVDPLAAEEPTPGFGSDERTKAALALIER